MRQMARIPPAQPSWTEVAALRVFAEESRFRAARFGGRVFPSRGAAWPLVVWTPDGTSRAGPGHRVVQVLSFSGSPDLERLVPALKGRLQGLAVPRAGHRRLAEVLRRHPEFHAPYLCAPGRLQDPPPDWPENGVHLTRELAEAGLERRA